jgi:hypothetical protein
MLWEVIVDNCRRLAAKLIFARSRSIGTYAKPDSRDDVRTGSDANGDAFPIPYLPDSRQERNESLHSDF